MDFQWISLLEVLLRAEIVFKDLVLPEQCHTSVASGAICRRVMIRSEPSVMMANYNKIKRVKLPQSHIVAAVEGNWNPKE